MADCTKIGKEVAYKGLEPVDPDKPIPFNHNPHYYVKDEALKIGIRMHADVVMDFLNGRL